MAKKQKISMAPLNPVVKGGAAAGKNKKVQDQPPGMPRGLHDSRIGKACHCGRCSNEKLKKERNID